MKTTYYVVFIMDSFSSKLFILFSLACASGLVNEVHIIYMIFPFHQFSSWLHLPFNAIKMTLGQSHKVKTRAHTLTKLHFFCFFIVSSFPHHLPLNVYLFLSFAFFLVNSLLLILNTLLYSQQKNTYIHFPYLSVFLSHIIPFYQLCIWMWCYKLSRKSSK